MQLKDWLAQESIGHAEFAPRIGRTAEAVRRYAVGLRIPDRDTMPRIVAETGGAVTAGDFYGDHAPIPDVFGEAPAPAQQEAA